MATYVREPINGFTHLGGAIVSFVGLLALVIKTTLNMPSAVNIGAVIIFGISLVLLYAASAIYHLVVASDNVIAFLRKIDHAMIFILIAGSYAPYCLIGLGGVKGWVFFGVISTIGICGVLFKMIWFKCPRWISTAIYVGMGWMAIFVVGPLSNAIPFEGVFLLALGGVFYTIGAVIYGVKPKSFKFKYLGYHEIFHIFILLGSICHFISVFNYVI